MTTRDQARKRILEAARKLFLERGFEAANLDEVAQRAGVAKGTIYRYFDSKAELYVEVLVWNADAFVERMRHTLDPSLSPQEQVLQTGRFYVRHYAEHPEYFRIFWAVENQRMIGELPEPLLEIVWDLWKRGLAIAVEIIENGVKAGAFRPCDPWQTASLLWVLANGLIQSESDPHRRELRHSTLEEVIDDAFSLVVRGMSA
jgi:AcrR family transcriptional regulator